MSTKSKRRMARRAHHEAPSSRSVPSSRTLGEQPSAEARVVLGAVMGAFISALTFGALEE